MWINRRTVKPEEAYSSIEQEAQTAAKKSPYIVLSVALCAEGLTWALAQMKEDRDNKWKDAKTVETRRWLGAEGPCGCYYSEGWEYQRATSKACLPTGKQTAVIGGKKQLTGDFPRQELQLPTQPSSQHVSSVCSSLCLWPALRHTIPQPRAYRGHSPKGPLMTFTHLPFEMDNYHMWPKSPARLLIQCGKSSFWVKGCVEIHRGTVRDQRGLAAVSWS